MTPVPPPVPDVAVQLVADEVNAISPGFHAHALAHRVVAALADVYEFCPPGTLAEVAVLRAVVPEVRCPSCSTTIRARLADQPGALDALPARDAAPAGAEGGEA
jgi:hypothetical protein